MLLERCKERVQATERSLLEGLPSDEEQLIRRWLVKIAQDEVTGSADGGPAVSPD